MGPQLSGRDRGHARALGDAFEELGPQPGDVLRRLYASADALLFPSLYEGFGWPPLEAMASGLPVVCGRGGALPEVVAGAALTAEATDVEGLAQHLAAVLTTPALARSLRERGLARAAHFTWSETARKVSALYARVLEESQRCAG